MGDPRRTSVDLIIVHFGVPTTAYPDRLVYDLVLWPDHAFEWHLNEWGGAGFDGFRLKADPELPTWIPLEISAIRSVLRTSYLTAVEVDRLFGEPALDLSWGQLGEWYFGPSRAGDDICFAFDYGLLRAITVHEGVIVEHRGTQ